MLLALLSCSSAGDPPPPVVAVPVDDVVERFASLAAGQASPAEVSAALEVSVEASGGTPVAARYVASSAVFPTVELREARGTATSGNRVLLTVTGTCVPFEKMKNRFGFAHAVTSHPGTERPAGTEDYRHTLPTGTLIVTYTSGCLSGLVFQHAP